MTGSTWKIWTILPNFDSQITLHHQCLNTDLFQVLHPSSQSILHLSKVSIASQQLRHNESHFLNQNPVFLQLLEVSEALPKTRMTFHLLYVTVKVQEPHSESFMLLTL